MNAVKPFALAAAFALFAVANAENFKAVSGNEWKAVDFSSAVVLSGSALDLSALVEEGPAGKYGRVICGADGQFVFEKRPDKAVRFFSYDSLVHERSFNEKSPSYKEIALLASDKEAEHTAVARHVEAIRLQGYNMIRMQGLDSILTAEVKASGDLNEERLDRFEYLVSRLKKAGIYFTLDMAYHSAFMKGKWDEADQQFMRERYLLDPEVRIHWERGVKALLTHRNPYTGMTLAQDPALATITLWNEQDLYVERGFFQNAAIKPLADQRWREFLKKRYGNIDALQKAWGNEAGGLRSFDDIGFEKNDPLGYGARGNDAGIFVYELEDEMTEWYEKTVRKIGYTGLTHHYDTVIRFRNCAVRNRSPVIAMHTYHNHPSSLSAVGAKMPQNGAIVTGGAYWRLAASARYLDRPLFVTENNFPFWGKYRHEAGLLYPAYSAFQGFGGITAHCQPVISTLAYPMASMFAGRDPIQRAGQVLGALLFARGDVSASTNAVKILLTKDFLFSGNNLQKKLGHEQSRLSLLCRFGLGSEFPPPPGLGSVSPARLSLLPIGGGEIAMTSQAAGLVEAADPGSGEWAEKLRQSGILGADNKTSVADGVYQTDTKEILMNTRDETLTLVTPRTEGAVVKDGRAVDLGAARLESSSVPASISLSSLDGAPLEKSSRILLIYSTDALNTDFETSEDRTTVVNFGTLPILMRTGMLTLSCRNAKAGSMKLWALGIDGSRRESVPLSGGSEGKIKIAIDTSRLSKGPTPFFELAVE